MFPRINDDTLETNFSEKELIKMTRLLKAIIATTLLVITLGIPAFSRSSTHERVEFEINVPFRLAHSNVLLPPGKFLLYQPDANDSNLFALYPDDLMHLPIAWITTTRVEHLTGNNSERTDLMTDIDEEDGGASIISGWDVAGEDGWEVIAVYLPSEART